MGLATAVDALRELLRDPEDTSQVFRLIEALSGRTSQNLVRRLRRTAEGRALLRQKPDIIALLCDRTSLASLPEGSLGRAYLAFCEAEGITAEGLVEASERGSTGEQELTPDEEYVGRRMRDTHDLWHALTGYHGDLVGEASILAFTFAQTRNRGVGVIVAVALLKAPMEYRRLIAGAFLRGRRAAFLPAQPWEELLELPLDEVRARLAVDAAPAYEPFRSQEYLARMAS